MKVEIQTVLNIFLSIITVYLAIRNFVLTSRKDIQRESQEMTEIRVQLSQVMDVLHDLQKDVRTSTADFRKLSDRVLILETKLGIITDEVTKLKEGNNGQQNRS